MGISGKLCLESTRPLKRRSGPRLAPHQYPQQYKISALTPYTPKNPLPIVFLSGGLEEINKGGHCYTVVIESQPTRKMWIKDPNADEWARVREKPRQIAEKFGIKEIGIIHGLPTESSSQCILEAYRFLGQILDGKYRNGFLNLPART